MYPRAFFNEEERIQVHCPLCHKSLVPIWSGRLIFIKTQAQFMGTAYVHERIGKTRIVEQFFDLKAWVLIWLDQVVVSG